MESDEDAFWCLEELLNGEHQWRDIFSDDTPKLVQLLEEIELKLKKKVPKVLKHLTHTINLGVAAAFSSIFITLFVYDLPVSQAMRIFEVFMLDGDHILIKFVVRMIKLKEKKILSMFETADLLKFIRSEMISECLQEYPLSKLLK